MNPSGEQSVHEGKNTGSLMYSKLAGKHASVSKNEPENTETSAIESQDQSLLEQPSFWNTIINNIAQSSLSSESSIDIGKLIAENIKQPGVLLAAISKPLPAQPPSATARHDVPAPSSENLAAMSRLDSGAAFVVEKDSAPIRIAAPQPMSISDLEHVRYSEKDFLPFSAADLKNSHQQMAIQTAAMYRKLAEEFQRKADAAVAMAADGGAPAGSADVHVVSAPVAQPAPSALAAPAQVFTPQEPPIAPYYAPAASVYAAAAGEADDDGGMSFNDAEEKTFAPYVPSCAHPSLTPHPDPLVREEVNVRTGESGMTGRAAIDGDRNSVTI